MNPTTIVLIVLTVLVSAGLAGIIAGVFLTYIEVRATRREITAVYQDWLRERAKSTAAFVDAMQTVPLPCGGKPVSKPKPRSPRKRSPKK